MKLHFLTSLKDTANSTEISFSKASNAKGPLTELAEASLLLETVFQDHSTMAGMEGKEKRATAFQRQNPRLLSAKLFCSTELSLLSCPGQGLEKLTTTPGYPDWGNGIVRS